jgi:hypothetical protein
LWSKRGLEGEGRRHGARVSSSCAPCPSPSLYRWPRGCLGRPRRCGVPMGLLLPKGVLPTGESSSKEDCNPTWSRIPPIFRPPTPWTTWGSLGGLPPRLGAWGSEWYCPEPSRSFQDLPGSFRDIPEPSGALPRPSGTVLGRSGAIRIVSKTIRVTV